MEHILNLQNLFGTSLLLVILLGLYAAKKYLKDYLAQSIRNSSI